LREASEIRRIIVTQLLFIALAVFSAVIFFILLLRLGEYLSINPLDLILIIWPALLFDLGRNLGKAVILPIDRVLRVLHPPPPVTRPQLISVVIPAHNEEKTIAQCIESVLENEYPWKEVIVVDDGSTDNTYLIASQYTKTGIVKVFRREPASGYRAIAVNYGIFFARGDLILWLDADSVLGREALNWTARYFEDKSIVAAAGNLRVLNRDKNLLTKLQSYEYFLSFEMGRRTQSRLRTLLIIPGGLGAWRKSHLESLGRIDKALAEDFDTTLKFHKLRERLIFMPEVMSWTEVPETWRDWIRQRIRWARGQLQSLKRHRLLFFKKRFGVPGMVGAPDMVLMDILLLFLWSVWAAYVLLARVPIIHLFILLQFVTELFDHCRFTLTP